MPTSSYRTGAWFAVFGSATTLLLPGSEKARVADLWSRIDDGAGFDEVLDVLLQSGLGALPGFVLVSGDDGPTKVLARGPVQVTGSADGEQVSIDGRDALTWVERTLDDVESLALVVLDDGSTEDTDDVDLPIVDGLVRVSRVDQPAVAANADADASSGTAGPAPAAVLPSAEGLASEPEPEAGPEPEPVPESEASPLDGESDTANMGTREDAGPLDEPIDPPEAVEAADSWGPRTPAPPAAPPAVPPSAPPAGLPPAPPVAPTDVLSMETEVPAPPTPPAAPPTDDDPSDHDGLTRTGASSEAEFARELPGIPGQPAAPRVVAPVAELVISNGETIPVDRVILVGRAPEARRFTSTEQPRLVKVPSPLHEISSTHLEVRPGSGADHGSAVVTDMGSTNGTVLEQPGLGPEDLKPGIAVQLIPGATINLGDGVTILVSRP